MNKLFLFIVNRHQEILKYLIILVVILIISRFFPRTGIFKYDFEIGKPWKYETLYAPYDLGIKKSADEIDSEQKRALEQFSPYYRMDTTVVKSKKESFIQSFQEQLLLAKEINSSSLTIDSAKTISVGLMIIEAMYDRGIIHLADQHKELPGTKEINVLRKDNVAEVRRLNEMFSIQEAYDFTAQKVEQADVNKDFLLPLVQETIDYNVFYDEKTTRKFKKELLNSISYTRGMVKEGERIISRGTIVTPEKYQILLSYKQEYEERVLGIKKGQLIYFGNVLATLLIIVIFTFFLKAFSPEVFNSNRKLSLVFLLMTLLFLLIAGLVNMSGNLERTDLYILYAAPVCVVPIILRTFFGSSVALHAHIATVLLCSFVVPFGFEFIFLQILAGMVAIFSNIKAYYWSQFFSSIAFIFLTYMLGYFAISIIQEGSFQTINLANFGWLTLSVLLTLLAYPLVPLFEKLFGFVSEITLLELSDINKPLLKDLSLKAPGTFQHSLQVANLAEAAAFEVGGNTLLVKVGALYHDIGKTENPLYFIENQSSEVNPHDDLTFEESAKIIIGHVKKGIQLAKRHNLPDILIDFIRTHHGTTVVQYFYQSYLKNYPDKEVDVAKFTYPGPIPYSKETAILMMADSVEAAARSLKSPGSDDINNLVEKIIQDKIDQNQFINSSITFKEITTIKKLFKKMLNSIYHVRISYPESVEQ